MWLLGRSLGNAARFVRRLVPRRRGGDAAAESASPALREHERARRRLALEIVGLEAEIERLHGMITSNATPLHGEGAGRSNLSELLDQSRQKRELLYEKRQALSRVERYIARERRLSPLEPPEVKARRSQVAQRVSVSGARRQAARSAAPESTARQAAVARAVERGSFGNRGQRLAFERNAQRLLDKDPDIRREAVLELSRIGGPDVPDLLLSAVDDSSERVRLAALNALVGSNHRASAEVFRRYLHDKNAALRLSALRGLASLNPRFLPNDELTTHLEDSDAAIRRTAANVLGWRRDGNIAPDVIHALTLALHDHEDEVRVAVAEALGNLGDHRGVLALINTLKDASTQVSEAAERALRAVLGEQVDGVGKGLSKPERVAALKAWWKEARPEAYLAAHAGELPAHAAEPRPAFAAERPAASVAAAAAAPAARVPAPPAPAAAKPAAAPPAPAAAKPAVAPPAQAPAAPRAQPVAEPPPAQPAVVASEPSPQESAAAVSEEPLPEGTEESGEEFENMFAAGAEQEAEGPSEGGEEQPGEEAESEEGEGGFEDIFGGESE